MISPLRTWQHQDPKGLWPALGGLAFLAHVGVIGMSVPYLLSWQTSGEQSSAAAIPIELVAIAPAESAGSTLPNTATSENSQTESLNSRQTTESQESLESSPKVLASQPSATSTATSTAPVQVSPGSTTSRKQTERSEIQRIESSTSNPSTSEPSSSLGDETDKENDPVEQEDTSTSEDAEESSDVPQPSADSEQPAETDATSQEESLPTIEGGAIPAPSSGTEASQSLQIRVIGAPQYDPVEDFESAPPELVDTGYAEVLQPEDKGCNTVSAEATGVPLVYRIGVNEDGTIYSASLQSSQSAVIAPADDAAVTCLIVNSGITFTRSGDSASKIDDNLLMTFELNEL